MLGLGRAFDGFFAISSRARGVPLEHLSAEEWREVLPSLFSALDAMRTVDLSGTRGYGSWNRQGNAAHDSWREFLLSVADDSPAQRTHGWRNKLIDAPGGDALFRAGHARLAELADAVVNPRHLVHCDLINRNVLVANGKLSAVFDWGCSFYGDFLYDVAWLEFWSPWFSELESIEILHRYRRHCDDIGLEIAHFESRLKACLIHIGLDHLAYNAHTGDMESLRGTAARLEPLLV